MPDSDTPWFVYLLECTSGRIYTGVSPHLDRRIAAHRRGKGALFTKINKPIRVLAAKPFPSKHEALVAERQIKPVRAAAKRVLAATWNKQHPISLDLANAAEFVTATTDRPFRRASSGVQEASRRPDTDQAA